MTSKNESKEKAAWNALYDASELLIKEIYMVHASTRVLRVVGLNVRKIHGAGKEFINFSSLLSQRSIVIGIESIFERTAKTKRVCLCERVKTTSEPCCCEKPTKEPVLCSLRGVLALAERVPLRNKKAVDVFTTKYGADRTDNWRADVEKIFQKQSKFVSECMKHTSKVRNQRMAHLAQPHGEAPSYTLPSVGHLEQLIEFAHDFHTFISVGFLDSATGTELRESIGKSLLTLLKDRFEIHNAKWDFPEQSASLEAKKPPD